MSLPSIPDYSTAIGIPQLVLPKKLAGGHPFSAGMNTIKYAGGFCVVFPFQTPSKKYAIRCWHAEISDAKKRTRIIAETLQKQHLPYFVKFEFFDKGISTSNGIQPIVVMDWVNAFPLKKYISTNINKPSTINALADNFLIMVKDLHNLHIAHGDLQHGNIMVKEDGSIVLVDYDSMYVPALKGMKDEIKGLPGYQHESRWKNDVLTEKADYFSELVIYLSLKALAIYPSYWKDLDVENTETMLFTSEDIKSKGSSQIFYELKKNEQLAPLVEKLCEFMQTPSLNDLIPLETALVSKAEHISSKWGNGNGYIVPSSKTEIEDPDKIAKKWKITSPKTNNNINDIINNIRSKWNN